MGLTWAGCIDGSATITKERATRSVKEVRLSERLIPKFKIQNSKFEEGEVNDGMWKRRNVETPKAETQD